MRKNKNNPISLEEYYDIIFLENKKLSDCRDLLMEVQKNLDDVSRSSEFQSSIPKNIYFSLIRELNATIASTSNCKSLLYLLEDNLINYFQSNVQQQIINLQNLKKNKSSDTSKQKQKQSHSNQPKNGSAKTNDALGNVIQYLADRAIELQKEDTNKKGLDTPDLDDDNDTTTDE